MSIPTLLTGLGAALPSNMISNDYFAERLDTSDEWIRSRTGIRQRYWSNGASTGDLAVAAGRAALESAGLRQVDMVVLATTTPDHPCPATAPEVAWKLELGNVPAFDLAAVCSGFLYGLAAASSFIGAGVANSILVIGAETYSTILNREDRRTAVIFGDGGGAAVLRAGGPDEVGGFGPFDLGSAGEHRDLITVAGGGSRQRSRQGPDEEFDAYFTMRGKEVFRHAVEHMSSSAAAVLARTGWSADDLDLLIAHQANTRILHSVADTLGLPRGRVVVDLDRVGNTSAASIPLAMVNAAVSGTLTAGDKVLLSAFGGGLTWASTTLVWPELTVSEPVFIDH